MSTNAPIGSNFVTTPVTMSPSCKGDRCNVGDQLPPAWYCTGMCLHLMTVLMHSDLPCACRPR
jgi:hypothetical protein